MNIQHLVDMRSKLEGGEKSPRYTGHHHIHVTWDIRTFYEDFPEP